MQYRFSKQFSIAFRSNKFFTSTKKPCFIGLFENRRRNENQIFKKQFSNSSFLLNSKTSIQNTRNIGIIAHIDAGKTTLTERMLYYSGYLNNVGEVHDGDTVMDFMELERERGITIGAAAISFPWKDKTINLIDTPGHIDFTVEVERSVRVLDGAVAVFDGVAGVQAQSVTVWRQATRHQVPCVAFINKLDREGASLNNAVETIRKRLDANPLLLQIPLIENSENLDFIVDIVELKVLHWKDEAGNELEKIDLFENNKSLNLNSKLNDLNDSIEKNWSNIKERVLESRTKLLEMIVESLEDESLIECCLNELEGNERVDSKLLINAIRTRLLNRSNPPLVPVLAGSALKNRGIQPVLDAVCHYLPDPSQRAADKQAIGTQKDPLIAYAFKVVHDHQRGLVVWLRILSGTLNVAQRLTNVSTYHDDDDSGKTTMRQSKRRRSRGKGNELSNEKVLRLLRLQADDEEELRSATAGDIVAAVGLKNTATGQTLTLQQTATKVKPLATIAPPPHVFVCSIDTTASGSQNEFENALEMLQLEDPSIGVSISPDSGQTLISGMGQLHLDIVKDRLQKHFKIPVSMGEVYIAYRAMPSTKVENFESIKQVKTGGTIHSIQTILNLVPLSDEECENKNVDELIHEMSCPTSCPNKVIDVIESGIEMACEQGALAGVPLTKFKVEIERIEISSDSNEQTVMDNNSNSNNRGEQSTSQFPQSLLSALETCITSSVVSAAKKSDLRLLEPIMQVEIELSDTQFFGSIMSDLTSQRRGVVNTIQDIGSGSGKKIDCEVPLKELMDYSDGLRSVAKGTASFSMEFKKYGGMPPANEKSVLESFGVLN